MPESGLSENTRRTVGQAVRDGKPSDEIEKSYKWVFKDEPDKMEAVRTLIQEEILAQQKAKGTPKLTGFQGPEEPSLPDSVPEPESTPTPESKPATELKLLKQNPWTVSRSPSIRTHIRTAARMKVEFSEPPTPIIGDGLLDEGTVMVFAGDSGVGKSTLMVILATHIIRGKDFHSWPITEPRRVLIIQDESGWHHQNALQDKVFTELNLSPEERQEVESKLHLYIPPEADLILFEETYDEVRDYIEDEGIGVVVWDPLIDFHTADENDNTKMAQVMRKIGKLARDTSTGSIVVHHFTKQYGYEIPGSTDWDRAMSAGLRIRGAGSIRGRIDAAVCMVAKPMGSDASSKKDPENGFQITLLHAKTRHSPFKPSLVLERHKDSYLFLPFIGKGLIPPEIIRRLVDGQGGEVKSRKKFIALIRETYEVESKVAEESIDWAVKKEEIKGIPGPKPNSPTRYESSTRSTGGKKRSSLG